MIERIRGEIEDLSGKLNAAVTALTRMLTSKHEPASTSPNNKALQPAKDIADALQADDDSASDDSKAVARTAGVGAPPAREEKYWPGNDPMYGDPGVGKIPGGVASDIATDLPHDIDLLSSEELKEARRARFMAR